MKTNYLQFKQALSNTGKTYFNLADLMKFYSANYASLQVLLSEWSKKDLINHLGRGFYTFNLAQVDYLSLALAIELNSYISFEYGLYYHNLIDQVPSVVTLATKKRSRRIKMSNWIFEYTHLKDDLFFGYELKDKIYIAKPEKALSDLLYLMARGKRSIDFVSLEKKKINLKELKRVLKKFPNYVTNKAKEMEII